MAGSATTKRTRCENGKHKDRKTGTCRLISKISYGAHRAAANLYNNNKKYRPRCKSGTLRNRKGNCVSRKVGKHTHFK